MKDASNLIRIPETLPLELAAMLPCGALAAYSAVQRIKPFILDKLENTTGTCFIIIIIIITLLCQRWRGYRRLSFMQSVSRITHDRSNGPFFAPVK